MGHFRNSGAGCSLLMLASLYAMGTSLAGAQTATNSPAGSGATAEETGLGEIVVTAQRRSELQRDVPISITAISAEQLKDTDARQLTDISEVTPALRFDGNGPFVQPTIRGVGTAVAESGGGADVGIYIDGFYSPNPLAIDSQLLNVEGVQVLKGPQGTLFGRNTTGGAVLITTAKPSQETSGEFQVSYGRFNTQQYEGYATTGITDKIAVDIEGVDNRSDGFQRNIYNGDNKSGSYDNWAARAGLKFDPTDTLSFLLRYQHSATNDPTNELGGTYVVNGKLQSIGILFPGTVFATSPSDVSNSRPVTFSNFSNVLQLTSTLNLPFATLTSYSQGRWEKAQTYLNQDYSSQSFFALSIPVYNRTFSQEFLLASTGDSQLQWTTGLFFFDNSDQWEDIRLAVQTAPPLQYVPLTEFTNSGTDTRSSAAFADLTYEFIHNFFFTAGARYSHDEVLNAYFQNFAGGVGTTTDVDAVKTNTVTPRAVLRWKPDDESSVYFSFSKGYKAPILNVGGGTLDGIKVASESIKAYEVGYKYGSGPFTADVAAYHYDYTNLQVASYIGTASLINNAASAKIDGIEGDLRYKPVRFLEFNAGANYMNARYENYPDATGYSQCLNLATCGAGYGTFLIGSVNASGNEMQRAPKLTGNLGARFTADIANGEFALSGNAYHTSRVYFVASNEYSQPGYSTLNLRAEWTDPSKRYTFAIYGDNVTNTRYLTQVALGNFAIGSVWNYPAMFGVSAKVHF